MVKLVYTTLGCVGLYYKMTLAQGLYDVTMIKNLFLIICISFHI